MIRFPFLKRLGDVVLAGLASALRNAAWTFTALRRG